MLNSDICSLGNSIKKLFESYVVPLLSKPVFDDSRFIGFSSIYNKNSVLSCEFLEQSKVISWFSWLILMLFKIRVGVVQSAR